MSQPFIAEDLLRFVVPVDLALSPDDSCLAYVLLSEDSATNKRHSAIWLHDLLHHESPSRQFTSGTHADTQPAWSPDGHWLAFVSTRSGSGQIWIIPVSGGEPRQVTWMYHGASHPRWSPDGKYILFSARIVEDGPAVVESGEKVATRDADLPYHVTRLQYRWDGGPVMDEGRTHLWLVSIAADGMPGVATPLTNGDFDHSDAVWSPDGNYIAFISDRADNRDANATSTVWCLERALGQVSPVSDGMGHPSRPSWSPDGQMLAWYEDPFDGYHTFSNAHIIVAERDGEGWHSPRDVMPGEDLCVGASLACDIGSAAATIPLWAADGQSFITTAYEQGMVTLWRVGMDGNVQRLTTTDTQIGTYAITRSSQQLYAIAMTSARPLDIAHFKLESVPVREPTVWLTEMNSWLNDTSNSLPEEFTFAAPDGWSIQGWLQYPLGANEPENTDKRWPLVVLVHGGPHGYYGPAYSANRHLLLSMGYATLIINPRGSVGYGETFARACDRDWGGADYSDIMAGIDAVLIRGRIDSQRLAITGTSYGGYMTNWALGHTDRFKAGVAINSVSNLLSSFGTSDVDTVYGVVEQGGSPWERMQWYIERSPITYAPQIVTPLRVIGSENDWRCPIEQSEQMYQALKYLGRADTDFLRFPNVGHNINKGTPRQRVAMRQAVAEWIARYVTPGGLP
jgi:dipeptidyl aminopeptidase/acylaminoacyl peptidase